MNTKRIKQLLKIRGISMQNLAEKLGINRVNLSASLNGNPTYERLKQVADILEVDMSELFSKPIEENKISGYLEFKDEIYRIDSISDILNFLDIVKASTEGD